MISCGQDLLSNVPFERRKIPYEDVYPMLYLKYRLTGESVHKNIKHLVIDEMQDYSYLQYLILNRIFRCRMTILGDRAQTLDKEQRDVLNFLPKIFGIHSLSLFIQINFHIRIKTGKSVVSVLGHTAYRIPIIILL